VPSTDHPEVIDCLHIALAGEPDDILCAETELFKFLDVQKLVALLLFQPEKYYA